MNTVLKKLVAAVLIGSLVAVVTYATLMPNAATKASPDRTAAKSADGAAKGGEAAQGKGRRGARNEGAVPVLAATVQRKDVPVILDGVGTARALQTVTVKPQIDGTILRIPFREGQEVNAGDLLAEIDPATYKAQLDQLVARRALTQTQLDNARRDYERYMRIPGVVAQKTVDTQRAQVQQLEAQIKADTAAITNSETILGYTSIKAPFAGRTGMRLVDEGNLVRAGDAGIVVISQLKPIAVQFTLPQQQLGSVNRALATGVVTVEVLDADGRRVIDTGVLRVVDNQVDPQTGTVKMKAELPNAEQQLWPGQFANVRVRVDTLKGVVAIPTAAVQRGPSGTFAYVVTADGRAEMRPITLGLLTDSEAVVTAGLEPQMQVVTSGFSRLTDGASVTIQAAPEAPAPAAAGAAKKRGRDGKSQVEGQGQGAGQGDGKRRRGGEAVMSGEPGSAGSKRETVQ